MARTYAPGAAFLNPAAARTIGDAANVRTGTKKVIQTITLASQASGDDIVLGQVKAGDRFLGATLTTSVSLGTATVALGIDGSTAKYAAAATLTPTDTPTPRAKATAIGVKETVEKLILLTVGTAALPAAGTLAVVLEFATADIG